MGGGDLNMKKSWHPLLLKNQERVWLEEKKALEEKKKLDQLRKEKEEERQLQELQRLQEEQTGKKRTEKLEWMYTTPAAGGNANPDDLEDYLLGKKRVDKILTADENAKLGASHKNFIAVQNANTARDIASKIREDPLLAMKQQEQAAYQALMSNPLRLRELQERNGIKPKKNKEKKKRDRKEKKGKEKSRNTEYRAKNRTPSRSPSPRDDRQRRRSRSRDYYDRDHSRRSPSPDARSPRASSRSPSPVDDHRRRRSRSRNQYGRDYARRSPSPYTRRSRSPIHSHRDSRRNQYRNQSHSSDPYRRHRDDGVRTWPRSDESDHSNWHYSRGQEHGSQYADDFRKRGRSPSPVNNSMKRSRVSPSPPQSRSRPVGPAPKPSNDAGERATRLAAMQSNASTMEVDRQRRLLELLAKEKAELEAENETRSKSKGMGGFLSQEQKKVFSGEGGLEDRIRRGRGGFVVDAD